MSSKWEESQASFRDVEQFLNLSNSHDKLFFFFFFLQTEVYPRYRNTESLSYIDQKQKSTTDLLTSWMRLRNLM